MTFPERLPPLPPMKHNDILLSGGISSITSTSSGTAIPLTNDYVPVATDILCGRRGNFNGKHRGNRIFAQRVRDNISEYTSGSSRRNKTVVVAKVVKSLQCDGLRFIKFDSAVNQFIELTDEQVHSKVGHAIRDQIKSRNEDTTILERRPSSPPINQPRSPSLPIPPPQPPSVANLRSISALIPKKKKLPRRHSDTAIQYNSEIDTISPLIVMNSQHRHNDVTKEMPLQHDARPCTNKIATNQAGFQFTKREQQMRKTDLLSRVILELGGHQDAAVARVQSNDSLVAHSTIEQVLSCFLLPSSLFLGGQQEQQRILYESSSSSRQKPIEDDGSPGDISKLPPALDDFPPFFPVPIDAETDFEVQGVEELPQQGCLLDKDSTVVQV